LGVKRTMRTARTHPQFGGIAHAFGVIVEMLAAVP
jgi:hypothetical protein